MGRRKKVDSENIKSEKIKAVNNLENSAGEILMRDVDVAMLSERLLPPPTFHNTTHQPPSSSCKTSPVCLVDTIPSSSANGMTNLNTDALLEGNRLMVLHSILDSVTVVEQEWPRSAILAVQKRFERMPRNGWPATLRYYNEKFSCTLDIDAFKKLAQNEAEREIRQEENGERRRIATYNFLSKLKEISEKDIGKVVVRTRKLPTELVDSKVLDLINRIIGEYADSCVAMTITAIARIIQAAQVCYDEAKRKEKPRSAWKINIESKISKLVLSKDLLEKARKQEKLSTSETKSLKKIMREFNLNLSSVTDLSEALVKKNESLNVYEEKITMYERRKQFRKENRMFEIFRGRFYRGLSERVESEHVVSRDEIVSFWSTMWNKNDDTVTYDDYSIPSVSDNHPTTFPSLDEFVNIINWLPNWKAAGIDDIYNFFIQKLTTLHKYIYDIVKVICLEGTPQADWFYCGLTYLIPKGIPRRGSDYRPITCMSNLYKLTTKCVTKVVQIEVEKRGLLVENQLGAVRGVQEAKEQIDVKKAYDSIDHAYLTQYIENLNLPDWILKFIKVIISKWKIDISLGPEKIMSKKIERGILQGDSLSPLLFVLCMDPLNRKLNEKYTKVTVQTDAESYSTNHLFSTLSAITDEAKDFLEVNGLEINKEKSATNDKCCEDTATLLEGVSVYKYLGIIEDSRGIPTRSSFEEVQSKLISRVEKLLLRLEPDDFSKLDDAVRAVLVKNKVHLRPGCKERLYLLRTELGRGLHSVELRSEHMLLQLLDYEQQSSRENNNKTHLALIKGFLKVKYRLVEEVTKKSLDEAQLAKLYNEIEKRKLHSKLYNARKNELVSVSDSSRWLKRRNIRPRNEAVNVFWGADGMCQHCGKSGKTVDHLATRCEKMLGHDYTRRHNEVVICLHHLLLNRYKFKSSKRIRSHSVQKILDNEYAEIRVDTRIKTDVKIWNNRPDIFILDKKKNNITLIEVGITSQDSLKIVETEKLRKYDLLANELGLIYKCSVEIIPYVMTWDGIVTKYHKSHLKRLEIPMNVEANIQSIVLKKTVETISFDRRRGLESGLNAEESWERASMGVIMRAEMHEEPTSPLKEEEREEDGAKNFKPKNKAPFISQGGTTLEEPTNNINKESDLEEETKVVKEVEENI
ncbi:reverse transcriptase [Hamiltosporidium tvaerminnensis]|uniref:Reverse transcriptase n=1 Tax=Hamiltosporidium tvaerminnensis TaxID=1176355 RepID=A0A4Q9LSL9_9MICR|nr:reverse transcriptase [Hamiltosporidium tvaerminnensis]